MVCLDKNSRTELVYPAIYRHFKGKYYATMGTSKPIESFKIIGGVADVVTAICMHAEHTETKDAIAIFNINNEWVHLKDKCDKEMVLYKSLYDNHGVYCRDVENFLEKIDSERKDNVTNQKYRFEPVEY